MPVICTEPPGDERPDGLRKAAFLRAHRFLATQNAENRSAKPHPHRGDLLSLRRNRRAKGARRASATETGLCRKARAILRFRRS